MKTIWKYRGFPIAVRIARPLMPQGAEILSAAMQGVDLCIWVRVDPEKPLVPRKIVVQQTGAIDDHAGKFVATIALSEGRYIHVFDVGEE